MSKNGFFIFENFANFFLRNTQKYRKISEMCRIFAPRLFSEQKWSRENFLKFPKSSKFFLFSREKFFRNFQIFFVRESWFFYFFWFFRSRICPVNFSDVSSDRDSENKNCARTEKFFRDLQKFFPRFAKFFLFSREKFFRKIRKIRKVRFLKFLDYFPSKNKKDAGN